MRYDMTYLRRAVRIRMDENADTSFFEENEDVDTLGINEMIDELLPDVLRDILLEAPVEQLGEGLPIEGDVAWEGIGGRSKGNIVLPDDFLRLLVFEMSNWSYGVHETESAEGSRYRQQGSRWGAGRGSNRRPVVFLVPQSVGLTLEWYDDSVPGGYVKRARYIAIPKVENGQLEIPRRLETDVVRATAEAVLKQITTNN